MENSKLPLQVWMLAFMFISATKKGGSCLGFQRQSSLSRYETAFRLMHKIRAVMGRRDSLYLLKDMVEYDEGYVEVATKKQVKNQQKRGKGSQRQAQVAVAAESTPLWKTPNLAIPAGFAGTLKWKSWIKWTATKSTSSSKETQTGM